MSLRLALVDDHQMFRDTLRAFLSTEVDVEIVFEASGGREACDLANERRPDVLVMDLSLPGMSGIDATAELRRRRAFGRVLAMSDRRDEDLAARAFAAGARGCVCKEQPAAVLLDAIRRVGRGEEYRPPWLSMFALDAVRAAQQGRTGVGASVVVGRNTANGQVTRRAAIAGGAQGAALASVGGGLPGSTVSVEPDETPGVIGPLTAREREVFSMLVGGDDNDTVARSLGLSVKTVETHRARIMKKLEVHTLAELVRLAARHGLL